ncbi:HAD-IA family hydrolase [uncultured Mitsuokella sp.]|uniref:HAD-IA family hydrolase n=1 Tax=uncultured Mitsuokella sp. TaxID=453120 RepID=UPI0025D7F688|nr:HAD-IA family hydrolase [uncultured Mitsuokella sp.]
MYQFDFLRQQDRERIISQIAPYSYVSFDIFDTLLKRDVIKPTDVFRLVGNHFNDGSFFKKRIDAEHFLRKETGREEITLDEIYNKLGSKYRSYKDQELKIEQAILHKNLVVYPIYQYCKEHNKTIIITSDMYLPENFLKDILHRQGIYFDFCFISSACGRQKVTGNLFKVMLTAVNIKPKEVVHIGDSVKGDYLGARKQGIHSILIPKIINRTPWINLKDKMQKNSFNVFINNHLDLQQNRYYQFGYAYYGPVLYGFVKWLHDSVGQKKIFFFARDGYIVKKVYDAVYPNSTTEYVYLSRHSLSVPLLWKHSSWDEFSRYITLTRFFSLRTLLKRLGLRPEAYEQQVQQNRLSLGISLQEKDFLQNANLKKFYLQIQDDIIRNSKAEFDALAAYFKQKNFHGDIAVVDIGWNGSMQRYLVELMALVGESVHMDGYYFGMRKKLEHTQVHGYFYEPDHMDLEPQVSFMQGLFESFFLSREGSTKRYELCNQIARPVLYQPEYHEHDIEYQAFQSIQQGASAFCEKYVASIASKLKKYPAKSYAYNLLRFGTEPRMTDVALFGDFRFYDTNVVYLAKPDKMSVYIHHPKQLVRDFSYAVWKAGFLKRCFRIKAPYMKFYTFLKKLH